MGHSPTTRAHSPSPAQSRRIRLKKSPSGKVKKTHAKRRIKPRKKSEAFKLKEAALNMRMRERFRAETIKCGTCGSTFNRAGINEHAKKCKSISPPTLYRNSSRKPAATS